MKVYLLPEFEKEDNGDGGIRRIVEAQKRLLPAFGVEFVDKVTKADLIAAHAGSQESIPTNIPFISHCHGLYWSEYVWEEWANFLNKKVIESIRIADAVTVPSKWVGTAISRGTWIKPTVIYHGVDPTEWEPGKNEGYVLWNKTRVDAICDPEPLNKLAAFASKTQFVSTYGKQLSNVLVTGRQPYDNAKRFVQNAGVYLCTARETFGIGTLEAMLCGVPILAWNWGGQAEIIEHKRNGWLANPGDYKSLQEGLEYCLENRQIMGEYARQYVLDNFTWDKIIPQYYDLYSQVLMPKTVKVSVVIPCYNLAQYLPETVASVLEQDFEDYEIIIVNDASPDNTKEVAQELALLDDRIKLINNETNQYLAGALNIGITAAQGEYIVPLDADNMLGKNALKTLTTALDTDRSIDIVYGSMQLIEPDGKRWISTWPPKDFNYVHQMLHRNQCPSTSMYRERIWSRVGGYRTRCKTAEDADFWCRATSFGAKPSKVTNDITLIYRNRHDSMSHTNKDWAWNKWYPWYDNEGIAPYTAPVQKPFCYSYEPAVISVVIPVGPGHGKYLTDAIDSVVAQKFYKYDIIVVNDSGEDLPWVPPFVRIVTTEGSKGPAYARNRGIEVSKAPLFIPLDADDLLQPEALSKMYEMWSNNGGYIYSDWVAYESKENKFAPNYNCEEIIQRLHHPVTALYPKQAWIDVGGFDETLDAWEDWDFVIAINSVGYCGTRVAAPLFYYRMTTGTRREEMYQKKEQGKKLIAAKWQKYIIRGEKLMACGGCAKGGKKDNTKVTVQPTSETVMIEYVRDDGPITYKGFKTGTNYRFGIGHKVKAVNRGDAEIFLLRAEFRQVTQNELEFSR